MIAHGDPEKRASLRRAFEPDFSVHTAAGAREAIALLERLPPVDALILDGHLPHADAPVLVRYLQEMVPHAESMAKLLIAGDGNGASLSEETFSGRVDEIDRDAFDPPGIRRRLQALLLRKSREKRHIMRASFENGLEIEADIGFHGRVPVENISESGMFVKTLLPRDYIHPIKIRLPDGETLLATGRVVRTDKSGGGVGIQFLLMEDESRRALVRLIAESRIEDDLEELRLKYPFLRRDNLVTFTDKAQIEWLIGEAFRTKTEFTVIEAFQKVPVILHPAEVEPWHLIRLAGENLDAKLKTSDSLFVSFQVGYATYTFETIVYRIQPGGGVLECLYPRILFYSEKRSSRRTLSDEALVLEIRLPPPFAKTIRGPVTDMSEGGVSFQTGDRDIALLIGTPLDSIRLLQNGRPIREVRGEVRNIRRLDDPGGGLIRYGVQFGIGRQTIHASEMPPLETPDKPKMRDTEKFRTGPRRHTDVSELAKRPPHVVRLENRKGEEIVGLLNTSLPLDEDPLPVVIIPPAFGKTKETLFALAQTIVENFYTRGKPVAVFRYDGIRRKGESFKDPDACEPPFEMIHASVSQGAEDIRAVLDWLQLNPTIKASSVVLVTFSLSALEARVLLRDESYRRQVDYWISCMGTMEFRELMNRVNCGLDLLEQYQVGIDLGVIPILGNLISMVPYASDVVRCRVATLDQARRDMAALDLPITWIYGEHDHWVKAEFVRDIMSVQSESMREVIAAPLGHNARTSEEALQLFGTVAALMYRFVFHDSIRPVPPNRKDMETMRRAEKDRIPGRKIEDRRTYWKRYLVGERKLLGFDVMALSDDYRQLLADQAQALDLHPDDRLLDLGGGTGNFLEFLLETGRPLPARLTVADLIPAALLQARGKILSRFPQADTAPGRFGFLALDAELNHFLPVRRFLEGEVGRFRGLAERIENLPLQTAERIDEAFSPRLHRILRGEAITIESEHWLKSRFDLAEYRVIVDFNAAVRYVRGWRRDKPVFRALAFGGDRDSARHLPFKPGTYDKVLMSLVLSYIFNPVETLLELKRILAPGGRLVLSTMRPDTDSSGLFTRLVEKIEKRAEGEFPADQPKALLLESIRAFLNDAQALVELEEAGTFDFFAPEKLESLLDEAGFDILRTVPSFGDPPQGYIVLARVREAHG